MDAEHSLVIPVQNWLSSDYPDFCTSGLPVQPIAIPLFLIQHARGASTPLGQTEDRDTI